MPTFKDDRAAAFSRPQRFGLLGEHVTKTDFNILEQQLETHFAKVEATIAQAHLRTIGIGLSGLAVATAILLTLG